jgi:hypothetical protein
LKKRNDPLFNRIDELLQKKKEAEIIAKFKADWSKKEIQKIDKELDLILERVKC